MSKKKEVTIRLTGRPPVTVSKEQWPLIATAEKEWHNGPEYDSDQSSYWWMRVRQHDNGRAVVYAGYRYETRVQGEKDIEHYRGVMVPEGSIEAICAAVAVVASQISELPADGCDDEKWPALAEECLQDMPPERLDDEDTPKIEVPVHRDITGIDSPKPLEKGKEQ